jgi:hypothetical protein
MEKNLVQNFIHLKIITILTDPEIILLKIKKQDDAP